MKASLFRNFASSVIVMTVLVLGGSAEAATLTLGASEQGWYRQDGRNNGGPGKIGNTFTGEFKDPDVSEVLEFRSFFNFDVSDLESEIEGATLRLPQDLYFSGDSSETVTVYDVTSATSDELASDPPSAEGLGIFDDLGSGAVYGEGTVFGTPGVNPLTGFLEITLSAAAISSLNEARLGSGDFSLGLALSSLGGTQVSGGEGVRFSDLLGSPASLVLQVADTDPDPDPDHCTIVSSLVIVGCEPEPIPEPGTVLGTLAALAFGGFTLKRRSKRD